MPQACLQNSGCALLDLLSFRVPPSKKDQSIPSCSPPGLEENPFDLQEDGAEQKVWRAFDQQSRHCKLRSNPSEPDCGISPVRQVSLRSCSLYGLLARRKQLSSPAGLVFARSPIRKPERLRAKT